MKTNSKIFKLILVPLFLMSLFSCVDDDATPINNPQPLATIAAQVKASADFTLLEAALTDAELFETLDGTGPFTVFAPTDNAFKKLLAELNVEYKDISKENLTTILKMHVLSSIVESKDLTDGIQPETLQGEKITINLDPNKITDPKARVSNIDKLDVKASNGIIHVIDNVILSKDLEIQLKTIAAIVNENQNFTLLKKALSDTSLTSTFEGNEPFTVFAPTDDAFKNLLTELGVAYEDINLDVLSSVLRTHVVKGKVESSELKNGVVSTSGSDLTINVDSSGVKLTDANGRIATVTTANVQASNGVIHIIDNVMLPLIKKEYALAEKDAPGISGKAIFALDVKTNGTIVTLDIEGTPEGGMHPAHIHIGNAATVPGGAIAIDLTTVEGGTGKGKSETNITETKAGEAITFAGLLDYNGYINVHKSAEELNVIVAQGNIGSNAE